ncbi:MAG TPA: folylpolyglutamate synthase/dihydrofolate synthase family protein [Candidatus Eremiobacteraceae bacterium]|nr:folylpolyglutamate synthase/dihydrofolate synthase family protein [Candidatus Eremiobacteraceae bacterium]
MDFSDAKRLLQAATNESISRRFPGRLDRMRAFLAACGNPEREFRSIHVGGTAGKGSTATMCAAILSAAGYKVGLHTKPHLHSVTERARIGGLAISEERFAELLSGMLTAIDSMAASEWGRPSYFELLVALAFRYFAEERVDVAVVEVGIGGTLDGTNLITPLVAVLTNVGSDHAEVLGDTIQEIATDKSGIIKDKVPVVTAADHPDALAVIRSAAERKRAPLTIVQEAVRIDVTRLAEPLVQRTRVVTTQREYAFDLPVLGGFQLLNAATAIVACEQCENAMPFNAAAVTRGLEAITLPGRMEYFAGRPSLIFDIAHNTEKAIALRESIDDHFPNRHLTFVCAIADGKDVPGMITAWEKLPANFIFTTFPESHLRPVRPYNLANAAQLHGLAARAVEDPEEALMLALRVADADDIVVVTGSTYLVGELRRWFLDNVADPRHATV